MLATGHTLEMAIDFLLERGVSHISTVCLVAAPEGVDYITERFGDRADIDVFTAALDEGLNENNYIVPGLGDAGDRMYGTA